MKQNEKCQSMSQGDDAFQHRQKRASLVIIIVDLWYGGVAVTAATQECVASYVFLKYDYDGVV